MLAWLKKIAPAPLGRPKKKAETRGRPSKAAQQAAQQEEDEPLRHSPPPEQQQPEQQQQTATAKVKKTRINWSLPENQEKLQKAIDEWEAQEETESQPGSFLTRAPPRAPSCTHSLTLQVAGTLCPAECTAYCPQCAERWVISQRCTQWPLVLPLRA